MTTEEKYNKALELARTYYNGGNEFLDTIFPELKESEDERIRRDIIHYILYKADGVSEEQEHSWIAYLEKQKDSDKAMSAIEKIDKYIDTHTANAHDMDNSNPDKKYYSGVDGTISDIAGILIDVYSEEKQKDQKDYRKLYEDIAKSKWFKKAYEGKSLGCDDEQKEQKPAEYLPKEKVYKIMTKLTELSSSQLIPINSPEYLKIHDITRDVRSLLDYPLEQKPEWSEEYREEDLRTRFAFYTYKDEDSVLYLSNVFVEETSRNKGFGTKILAAAEKVAETLGAIQIRLKVKQDSLANAWYRKRGYGYMAFEDGYDWLEKTLEYLKPAKSAEWSEEDEKKITFLERLIRYNVPEGQYGWIDGHRGGFVTKLEAISMLKSLRPKPHWKPSKEQMSALFHVIGISATFEHLKGHSNWLTSLYNDLKKL